MPERSKARVLAERSLRSCLARFATGVAVVSFDTPEERRGITVNSFTSVYLDPPGGGRGVPWTSFPSVSLEPPLVLVAVAKRARSHDALFGRPFCVNVL